MVVAANGGQPHHPAWYLNLRASPTARVEVGDRTLGVAAEELSAAEATAFWPEIVRALPGYARYQQATTRKIQLVRLVLAGLGGNPAYTLVAYATNTATADRETHREAASSDRAQVDVKPVGHR